MQGTVDSICNLLLKSRLLPEEALSGLRQRWLRETAGSGGEPAQFMRWLVANEYLTEFQAGRLSKGQTDRHFLGPYKLLDRIGHGDVAGVFKAKHKLGQIVAIKVLPPSKVRDAETFGRFKRESRLAMRLRHPNVVRAFQTGEADGLHFLAMEYLDGETLAAVLQRRGRLPPAEAARVIYQALLGLQHLHEHGLVHRDLKPDNLMLTPAIRPGEADSTCNATVKIVDIGLCRSLFEEDGDSGSQELTVAGAVLGNADYRAPEQSRDARLAVIRSDIYTLGCVLYRCLTGRVPFPDTKLVRQLVRHSTETPKPLRDFEAAAPDALQKIVSIMLAKDPAQRFSTPEQAADAILTYLSGEEESVRSVDTPAQMREYLTWLETNESDTAATSAAAIPVGRLDRNDSPTRSATPAAVIPAALQPKKTASQIGRAAAVPAANRPQLLPMRRPSKSVIRWATLAAITIVAGGAAVLVSLRGSPAPVRPPIARDNRPLAEQAHAVLEKHCFRCHGRDGAARGQVNYILNREQLVRRGKIMVNDAEHSKLFQLVRSNEMPPESVKERPDPKEVAILKKWIDAGAPSWNVPIAKRHLDYGHILTAIHDDLHTIPQSERKYQRYFTLAHIYNQTETRKDLPLYRAALAKLINSLSWQAKIVVPREVDAEQTMYAVNLAALGWDKNDLWELEVLGRYPYGLRHDGVEQDAKMSATAQEVYKLTGSLQPFVRGDWFVARASRPPAYYSLLFHIFRLPEKAADLERELGVDVTENLRKSKVVRAGYLTSNISAQNRLVERHAAKYGAYWKSYDFGPNNDRRNLLKFPLGPPNAFPLRYGDFAFKHDGGEIIFHLPNGMQGYFLADGRDTRLDEAPLAIVRDKEKRHSGSEVIVNGLSCMGCHIQGMIDAPPAGDAVRQGAEVPDTTIPVKTGKTPLPSALEKVRLLYPEKKTFEDLLIQDRRRFLDAVQQAIGSFGEFPTIEPISAAAKPYYEELGLQALATELYLESPTRLRQKLTEDRSLAIGYQLGTLTGSDDTRGVIARTLLEQLQGKHTTFQALAQALKLGTPLEQAIDLPP